MPRPKKSAGRQAVPFCFSLRSRSRRGARPILVALLKRGRQVVVDADRHCVHYLTMHAMHRKGPSYKGLPVVFASLTPESDTQPAPILASLAPIGELPLARDRYCAAGQAVRRHTAGHAPEGVKPSNVRSPPENIYYSRLGRPRTFS